MARPIDPLTRLLRPADPVLRALADASLVSTLGRGLFFTVSALFFTRVAGLDATQVGLGLTIAGAFGIGASFAAGLLADRIGARRLLVLAVCLESVGLLAYTAARSFSVFVVVACFVVVTESAAHSARSALTALAFTGEARVGARAHLRVVTNIGIGVGSAAAGVALAVDTATAYTVVIVAAALLQLASTARLVRIPVPERAPEHVAAAAEPGARWAALRDGPYLLVTLLTGVGAIQFGLFEIGVPLWVVEHTAAPPALNPVRKPVEIEPALSAETDRIASLTVVIFARSSVCVVNTVSGDAVSVLVRRKSVPVTTMSPESRLFCASVDGSCPCAFISCAAGVAGAPDCADAADVPADAPEAAPF